MITKQCIRLCIASYHGLAWRGVSVSIVISPFSGRLLVIVAVVFCH